MVLVCVGEHDRLDGVQPVPDGGEVGENEVDAGLVTLGEEHSAVDDEQPAVELEHGHVAPDLAETPERDDAQPVRRKRWRCSQPGVGMAHAEPAVAVATSADRSIPAAARSALSRSRSCSVASTSGGRTPPAGSPAM